MRLIVIIAGLLLSAGITPAHADVWEFRKDGTTVFHHKLDYYQRTRMNSDWKPPSPAVLRARRANYDPLVKKISAEEGVNALLVHALIEVESGYAPFAISKKGAVGMMQLMPKTAARFGVLDSRDPEANIRGGVKYLAYLSRLVRAGPEFVIAAYHAGEDRVVPCTKPRTQKNGEFGEADCKRAPPRIPNIPETKKHVQLVLQALDRRLEAATMADAVPVTHVTHSEGGTD